MDLVVGKVVQMMRAPRIRIVERRKHMPVPIEQEIDGRFLSVFVEFSEALVELHKFLERIFLDDVRGKRHNAAVECFPLERVFLFQPPEEFAVLFGFFDEFFSERSAVGVRRRKRFLAVRELPDRCPDDDIGIKEDDAFPLLEEGRKEVELVEDDRRMPKAGKFFLRKRLAGENNDPFLPALQYLPFLHS